MRHEPIAAHPFDHRLAKADLPYGSVTADLEVDNPLAGAGLHRRNLVTRSLRDDPLGRLHARGQIDEAGYRAGRAWQDLFEAVEVGRIGSINPAREYVDGGRQAEPFSERQRRAARILARVDRALGEKGKRLVRMVLGSGLNLTQVALTLGMGDSAGVPRADRDYVARRLRECLSTIAGELGLASRAS